MTEKPYTDADVKLVACAHLNADQRRVVAEHAHLPLLPARWSDLTPGQRAVYADDARAALDALAAAGRLLPAGTETVEQWGTRLTWDGHTEEHLTGRSRDDAQRRVDLHRRARVEQPGWRATAELVRRHQHTTPWTTVEEKP